MPQLDPRIGEIYRHFKGNLYQVRELAKDADTGARLVVYQALYGEFETYVRSFDEFVSEVDFEKYPEVTVRFRFTMMPHGELVRAQQRQEATPPKEERAEVTTSQTFLSMAAMPAGDPVKRDDRVSVPVPKPKSWREMTLQELMMAFLDERDFAKKDKILSEMRTREDLGDGMIDNLAAAIDVVIDEGSLEDRFNQLRTCVQTRARFENMRLRGGG